VSRNINAIFEQLQQLSLFELSRLDSAISKLLDDPEKNEAIKRHLRVGMNITYFAHDKNDLVEAVVIAVRRTTASVLNIKDNHRWSIKFHLINLEGIDVSIRTGKSSGNLDRYSLRVGDQVGWHSRSGDDLHGVVEKLNPKKALVRLGDGARWTVCYSLLFPVMDGAAVVCGEQFCIEGQVINIIDND
jgi:hypothetical protein